MTESSSYPYILKISFIIPTKSNTIESLSYIMNYMLQNQENDKEDIKNHKIYCLKYEFIKKQ